MDLNEIKEWAEKIDLTAVEEKRRHHVKCYKDMIASKTALIADLSFKTDKYLKDIYEYLGNLKKVGLVPPGETAPEPVEEVVEETFVSTPMGSVKVEEGKKPSPLLP